MVVQDCFNKEEALQKGIIVPKMGVNDDYDNVTSEIETIEEEFQTLLRKYKSQLQCGLNFFGAAKNRSACFSVLSAYNNKFIHLFFGF